MPKEQKGCPIYLSLKIDARDWYHQGGMALRGGLGKATDYNSIK